MNTRINHRLYLIIPLLISLSILVGCVPLALETQQNMAVGADQIQPDEGPLSVAEATPTVSHTEEGHNPKQASTVEPSVPIQENSQVGPTQPTSGSENLQLEQAQLIERGLALYHQQYCGVCHELTVAETLGAFGPPQDQMKEIAALRIQDETYTGEAQTPAEYIMESLVEPDKYIVAGYAGATHQMPSYDFLSSDDLEALVELLVVQE